MDTKELEDKLEKDNLTLKEHILKLQNTIKNIKTELSNTNNNTTYVNTLSQIDISTIKNSKVESPKNNGKLNMKDDSDEEINNLKFSFKNIKAAEQKLLEENKRKREDKLTNKNNKKDEEANLNFRRKNNFEDLYNSCKISNNNNNSNSISNTYNNYKFDYDKNNIKDKNNLGVIAVNNSHVHKENFSKIKNEKDIIQKMENVRSAANIKKNYAAAAADSDEDSEYEKFQRLNKLMKNDANSNYSNSYSNKDSAAVDLNQMNNYKSTLLNLNNNHKDKNQDIKGYIKSNLEDSDHESKEGFNSSCKKNDEVDQKYNSIPKYRNSKRINFYYN